eukprot:378575_1
MNSNLNPQSILDANIPFNVELFDEIVKSFYSGNSNRQIHDILARFEQSPNAWTKAPEIIQNSKSIESKMIALSILEKCIKTRWKILPLQQKKGIKGFVESLVVKLSQDTSNNLKDIKPFLTKLNTVLIEIIKREWPHNWPGFITQVVEVSKRSEIVCANNMDLLRLLSEEAFENQSLHLSHDQVNNLKDNLTKELSKVFELCMFVLKNSSDRRLIECTLNTLRKFLAIHWIPIPIIFSSQLIEALSLKYFNIGHYRVCTLECLVEIAGIKRSVIGGGDCDEKLVNMFLTVLRSTFSDCGISITPSFSMDDYIASSTNNNKLIQTLSNFLFNFLRYHHTLLEEHNNGSREGLKAALSLFLRINECSNQTLFQICCDFWEYIVRDLQKTLPRKSILNNLSGYDLNNARYELYSPAFHDLRQILMKRLPRPKEVLVVRDDNNNVIKQEMRDTLMLTLHRQMSRILYMLSAIDPSDTRAVIGSKLSYFSGASAGMKQKNNESQFFSELNSLCWSIGAVAGSMPQDVEKSFLVVVIKILLSLCEVQQSKNAKAMIASCIMYVVRKYPRFLKKHWKFLQTVVRKLIEFLAEKHPGVQDMSIETLNEICHKCGHKFLAIQENDSRIFLHELIGGSDQHCRHLNEEQRENLYATWSVIISHETRDLSGATQHISQLLATPNNKYQQLLAAEDPSRNVEEFIHLIRIYKGVCASSSSKSKHNGCFLIQFGNLYPSLLRLYTGYAQLMNQWAASPEGQQCRTRSAAPQQIRLMSTLKAQILELFEVFVAASLKRDHEQIAKQFVPQFLEAILTDYRASSCDIYRESACLNVCSALIDNLDSQMNDFIPQIFGTLFQITLDMIKKSMDNLPDHRLAFFKFLYAVTRTCFVVFEQMNCTQMQLVINCIMWAHEHIDHQICEYGCRTINAFLKHIRNTHNPQLITMFYQNFLFLIVDKLIHVMTDTLHKANFVPMCRTLKSIAFDIQNNQSIGPLDTTNNQQNNTQFVANHLSNAIQNKFPHLTNDVIAKFVEGLFKLADNNHQMNVNQNNQNNKPPYIQHCEDFLVAL